MKKLSMAIAGAVFSTLYLGLETAYAHGGELHLGSGHSNSGKSLLSEDPRLGSNSIFYGEAQPLGNGSMRTWLKLNSHGTPSDIGISFTETALSGLPEEQDDFGEYPLKLTLLDGIGNSTFEYELMFPKQAEVTPFTHLSLNYNPHGHAPVGITNVAHLDVHFNLLTPQERHAIVADDLDAFFAEAYETPPAEFIPEGFVTVPNAAEPRMGAHYADITSDELEAPWDRSFIYGFYGGEMVFWEPMIATSFLETKPNITEAIKQPRAYPTSGYYPTTYSVNYANGEYSVSLNGLTFRSSRSASVPEPSSTLGVLVLSAFGIASLLKRRKTGCLG